jgi:hypothetical protein
VVSFPQVSPPKPCTQLSFICATSPAHLIFLVLMTWTVFCEEYRSLSSSSCSFLHSRYLVPLRPKYYLQHTILNHPQPMFLQWNPHAVWIPLHQDSSAVCICVTGNKYCSYIKVFFYNYHFCCRNEFHIADAWKGVNCLSITRDVIYSMHLLKCEVQPLLHSGS